MGARPQLTRAAARATELVHLARLDDVMLLVVAAIHAIGITLAPALGLLGSAVALLLVLSLCRYGYALLRRVAQGKRELPGAGLETIGAAVDRAATLHFVFFAALTVLIAVTPWLPAGPAGAALRAGLAAAVLVAFPASAALVALTGELGGAVNPTRVAGLVRTLGRRYAALLAGCAGLLALWLGVIAVLGLGRLVPLFLLVATAAAWTFLATFALTGAALRTARLELEIPGDVDSRREALERRDVLERRQRAFDRAYASIRSNLVAQAYGAIDELVRDEGESAELHLWIVSRMAAWDPPHHALEVGRGFIARALARGEPDVGLELVMLCRRIDSEFAPASADARALAARARDIGKRGLAELLEQAPQRPS